MRLTKERMMSWYSSRKFVNKMRSDKAVMRGWNLSTTGSHFDIYISSGLNGESEIND